MSLRLTKIDALTRPDHHHLSEADECYYVGEYTARSGYAFSETNNLIQNLKKPLDRRGTKQWPWKGRAIDRAAQMVRAIIPPSRLAELVLVPVPPSKAKNDPLYDDRMVQVGRKIIAGTAGKVVELVEQREGMVASHDTSDRPSPDVLAANYLVNRALISGNPKTIVVLDDVLTTGAHFVAMKRVISHDFSGSRVVGLFLARRVPGVVDFSTVDLSGLFE